MSANDKQVGGEHYKRYVVEPWDFITKNNLSYLAGNVVKYAVRADAKAGVQDIDKAIHYLEKMREQFVKADVEPKPEQIIPEADHTKYVLGAHAERLDKIEAFLAKERGRLTNGDSYYGLY